MMPRRVMSPRPLMVALPLLACAALAQTPPTAGDLLRELPPPRLPAGNAPPGAGTGGARPAHRR